jgi:hypothetical protein
MFQTITSLKRTALVSISIAAFITLTACGGVPIRSIPRLLQMQNELLEANPNEFMVALQVDARLAPPEGAVPLLIVRMTPREPGAFEPIDKKLPLQLAVSTVSTLGLEAPLAGRRWLIYTLPAATQAELQRVQSVILKAKTLPNGKGGGTLSMGVEQDSLAAAITDPALANTRWETWLQNKQRDGFFEVWTGTPAQIQKLAAAKAR